MRDVGLGVVVGDLEDGLGEAHFFGDVVEDFGAGEDLERLCFGRRITPSGVMRSEGALLERVCLLSPAVLLFLPFFLWDGLELGTCFDPFVEGSVRDDLESLMESWENVCMASLRAALERLKRAA